MPGVDTAGATSKGKKPAINWREWWVGYFMGGEGGEGLFVQIQAPYAPELFSSCRRYVLANVERSLFLYMGS